MTLNKKRKKKKGTTLNVTDEEWRIAVAQVKANAIVFVYTGERPRDTDSSIARMHLLPLSSFFNHSCIPNAAFGMDEDGTGRGVVRAIDDIKKGEEINVCYHSELLYLPTKKRQAQNFLKPCFPRRTKQSHRHQSHTWWACELLHFEVTQRQSCS